MKRKPIGCLTVSGLVTALLTVLVVIAVGVARGGTLFNPGALNAKTGATLGGVNSHADLSDNCSACHAAFWQPISMTDKCVTCHTDVAAQMPNPASLHGNLLKNNPGNTCRSCHPDHLGANALLTDLSKANINHEAFGYSLAAHQLQTDGSSFACNTCHTNGFVKFDQAICTTCHEQIKADFMQAHLQAYGDKCLGCHDGVDTYGHKFDHSAVAFQLTGKHAKVECAKCHTGDHTLASLKATSQDCQACHAKDDIHSSQISTNCATCHTPAGWTPASFDHNLANFKLTGAHATVACTNCHINNVFNGTPSDCYSCHIKNDIHTGTLGKDCSSCHTSVAWIPSTFDHNQASFKLTGAHVSVACKGCHSDLLFKNTPSTCAACHAKNDPHQAHLGPDCSTCHTTSAWQPSTFDHNTASFKLTGAHVAAPCTSCHSNLFFTGAPTDCYSCHAKDDHHNGQFGTNCGSCHSTNAWLPATFDHGLSGFPLTGAHANLACTQCHLNNNFGPLSVACGSCHAEPAFHAGLFAGTPCSQCHSSSAWTPATYNGPHPGGCDGNCLHHERATCRDCHTVNLMTATCTKCHGSNNPIGGN
jgi:hypothetical protein